MYVINNSDAIDNWLLADGHSYHNNYLHDLLHQAWSHPFTMPNFLHVLRYCCEENF